jgi:hypothetical protein
MPHILLFFIGICLKPEVFKQLYLKYLVTIQPDLLDINLTINVRYTQRGGRDFNTVSKF